MAADVIYAGETGRTYVPPTVLTLTFDRIPKDEGSECLLTFKDLTAGPLKEFLGIFLCWDAPKETPSQVLGSYEKLSRAFRDAAKQKSAEERGAHLKAVAAAIWQGPQSGSGAVWDLVQRLQAVAEIDWRTDHSGTGPAVDRPLPLQIYLLCSPEMLAIPLDIALSEHAGLGHLCCRIPVIWRLRAKREDGWRPQGHPNDNLTDHRRHHSACSCLSDVAMGGCRVPGIANHHHGLDCPSGESLGLSGRQSLTHVKGIASLHDVVVAESGSERPHTVYVISHGVHGSRADRSGIVVGPSPEDGTGVIAYVPYLAPQHGEAAPGFAYFSCCHLGRQDPDDPFSYYGGFAEGAVVAGVCHEAICNRWSVRKDLACMLSSESHGMRPRTAQARAAALFHVRRTVLNEMKDAALKAAFDPTWLAPVHIWAWPGGLTFWCVNESGGDPHRLLVQPV